MSNALRLRLRLRGGVGPRLGGRVLRRVGQPGDQQRVDRHVGEEAAILEVRVGQRPVLRHRREQSAEPEVDARPLIDQPADVLEYLGRPQQPVEHRAEVDMAGLMQQLGPIPAPAPA